MLEALRQDIRYGFRLLLRQPGLSFVAVSTLALAMAATASLFSVLNATLLKPLPFDDPGRLVYVRHQYTDMEGTGTPPLLVDYRRELSSFESVSASYPWNANLTGVGEPERLRGLFVSADFFRTLGIDAWRGRGGARPSARSGRLTP